MIFNPIRDKLVKVDQSFVISAYMFLISYK